MNVVVDREVGVVNPDRPAAEERWASHHPPHLGDPEESLLQTAFDRHEIKAVPSVKQWPGFDDAKAAYVLRHSQLFRRQEHVIEAR